MNCCSSEAVLSSKVALLNSLFCTLVLPKENCSNKMNCTKGGGFPLLFCAVICLMAQQGACNVVLIANNTTLSFDDVEATFSECYNLPSILAFHYCSTTNAGTAE